MYLVCDMIHEAHIHVSMYKEYTIHIILVRAHTSIIAAKCGAPRLCSSVPTVAGHVLTTPSPTRSNAFSVIDCCFDVLVKACVDLACNVRT